MLPPDSRGRRIVEWLVVIVALLVGVPLAAWWGQDRLIFFPQPLVDTQHLPAHAQPFDLVAPDGTKLSGYRLAQPGRAPAMLYFGGNAEEISYTLADRRWPPGWTIAGLNYRGYGRSAGKPGERELVADALALFDAMAARPDVDARTIVVVGRSLGTGVAARVAAARPVAGTILISPYDSLVAIGRQHYPWLPVDWLLRHRFDSHAAVRAVGSPLLTVVGAQDAIVPVARSQALHAAWPGPKRWVEIDGTGHNDLGAHPAFWQAIAEFLAERMAAVPAAQSSPSRLGATPAN